MVGRSSLGRTVMESDMDMAISFPDEEHERRRSVIDEFCTLTHETSELKTRHFRGIVLTLSFVCMLLVVTLGVFAWRANAMEQERQTLVEALRVERAARISATLAAKDVEMNVATEVLDTQVRKDIVDERMVEQQQRSLELEQLAEKIAQQKLIEADCVTPKSVLAAKGL